MSNGGRLLIFGGIDNEILIEWVHTGLLIILFFTGNEVNIWLNFPDVINQIVYCVYLFIGPHFSGFSFGIVPKVEVKELQSLCWFRGL